MDQIKLPFASKATYSLHRGVQLNGSELRVIQVPENQSRNLKKQTSAKWCLKVKGNATCKVFISLCGG